MSPLNLSRTPLAGGGLLVLYSLSGSPVIKHLMQMVTMVPGQGGRFQCASPNSWTKPRFSSLKNKPMNRHTLDNRTLSRHVKKEKKKKGILLIEEFGAGRAVDAPNQLFKHYSPCLLSQPQSRQ